MDCCTALDPMGSTFDLVMLLTLGLTISIGHCTGMCGPLVLAFSAAQTKDGTRTSHLVYRTLVYNLGRVSSYTLLGAAMGLLGSALFVSARGRTLEGVLSISIAAIMMLMGASLLGWLPGISWLERLLGQSAALCRIQGLLHARSLRQSYALGFANGWLPCGPVFAAAMGAAATGSVWKGSAVMIAFGLGTIPVLFVLAVGSGRLALSKRLLFHRIGAGFIVLVGVQLLFRGMAAIGWVQHLRYKEFVVW